VPPVHEAARLQRAIDEVTAAIRADLGTRKGLSAAERTALRSELEAAMQRLDELRNALSG
jgi:hypothetical protein